MKLSVLLTVLLLGNFFNYSYSQNINVDGIDNNIGNVNESDSTEVESLISSNDSLQVDSLVNDTIPRSGSFAVNQDDRLDDMLEKYVEINQEKCPDLVQGYRIQIYSSSGTGSSQRAREERAKFLTFYPNVPAYNDYDAPNFRVRVGNFRTKLEAEELKKLISQEFPSCFIVPDYIETELVKQCE